MKRGGKSTSRNVELRGERHLRKALAIASIALAVLAIGIVYLDFMPHRRPLATAEECARQCAAVGKFSNPVPDGPMPAKPFPREYRCFCR